MKKLILILAVMLLPSLAWGTTTQYAITDSHVYRMGQWTYSANISGQPGYYSAGASKGAAVDFNATGTECKMQIYIFAAGDSFSVTIDGSASTVTPGVTGWQWVTLFTGLSDTTHTVSVYRIATTNTYPVHSTAGIEVTGDAPALVTPTGYSTLLLTNATPFTTYAKRDGVTAVSTIAGQTTMPSWQPGDGGVRFYAAVTDIWIWVHQTGGGSIGLWQDGTEIATQTVPSGTIWQLYHIATGLDNANHLYQIINKGIQTAMYLGGVMLTGTGLTATAPPDKEIIGWYGDSIVVEANGDLANSYTGMGWLLSQSTGTVAFRKGWSGKTVSTWLRDNTTAMTIPTLSKYVIAEGGVNDMAASATIGDCDTAGTFQGDMKTMLINLTDKVASGGVIFVQGILPTLTTNYANRGNYVNAQIAAVACYNATSPTIPAYFVGTDGWISTTAGVDTVESLHPNASGYAKIANRWVPIITKAQGGTSYTVTGPSSGSPTAASTNFTVTMAAGATFTGDQTITISDNDAGGTITPSVGDPGTGSVVVTPAASATSFTFTYTPSSAGDVTLSFDNGQTQWADAGDKTYTAQAIAGPRGSFTSYDMGFGF